MTTSKQVIRVALIEGDGIGPEIAEAVLYVIRQVGLSIDWQVVATGQIAIENFNTPLPEETINKIREIGVALKGPIATPIATSFRSVNVGLRKALDLYANFRPVKSIQGISGRYENIDLVFIRENTEGLYSGLEHEVVPGVVTSLKVATRSASMRIAEFAFKYAERMGRKKITAVHKANILKLSDGLSLTCYREMANRYPAIEYEEKIVDAVAMSLVLYPEKFDVLLMENLYGDILSDLGAGLIGGLGLAPSANFGEQAAVFEAVHGSAPDIAGKGIANPTALLLSAAQMLKYLSQTEAASRIENAIFETYLKSTVRTPDLGGKASTMDFAKEIASRL
jgi:isocitrate dehydrogenase (NAD+)